MYNKLCTNTLNSFYSNLSLSRNFTDEVFSDENLNEFYDSDTPDCDTHSEIDLKNIPLKYSSPQYVSSFSDE